MGGKPRTPRPSGVLRLWASRDPYSSAVFLWIGPPPRQTSQSEGNWWSLSPDTRFVGEVPAMRLRVAPGNCVPVKLCNDWGRFLEDSLEGNPEVGPPPDTPIDLACKGTTQTALK